MISRSASYAVRALTWMVSAGERNWALNREIADALSLPPQFLTKILRALTAAGVLESQRGKTGGFRLTRPAGRIPLLAIVSPFDRLGERSPCILGQPICSDETACPLHAEWRKAGRLIAKILADRTLADVARRAKRDGFPAPSAFAGFVALQPGAGEGRRRGAKRRESRGSVEGRTLPRGTSRANRGRLAVTCVDEDAADRPTPRGRQAGARAGRSSISPAVFRTAKGAPTGSGAGSSGRSPGVPSGRTRKRAAAPGTPIGAARVSRRCP